MTREAPAEAKDLLKEAIALHRSGDLTNSERLYTKVLEIDPEQTDALQLLGVIAAQMGNNALAIERVEASIAINPNQPGALNNLGNMLVDEDRFDEAINAYERAIHFSPSDAQPHFHLGHVYDFVDRHLDALSAYTRATELDPNHAAAWNALGATLEKLGRAEDAVDAYRKAIAIDPNYISPKDGLGKALRELGRLDEALEVYKQWLSIAPNDPIAKHYELVCGQREATPERASEDYVKQTFNVFADNFDTLLTDLDYRVPERVGEIAQQLYKGHDPGKLRIADLGCGTGLCGRHLDTLAAHLVGVDLSPGMLAKARQRDQYDELIESELTEYLQSCTEPFDLIVSADTLIYIGDLRSTFDAAASALRSGGPLIFSLEKLEQDPGNGEGYRLGISGRYQHTEACVREWLSQSGFTVQACVEEEVRKEGRSSVAGYLVTAIRGEADVHDATDGIGSKPPHTTREGF